MSSTPFRYAPSDVIQAVEVESFLLTYRSYAGRVSTEDGDRYVREMARVAEMVELPVGLAPNTEAELRDYLRSVRGLRSFLRARRTPFSPLL